MLSRCRFLLTDSGGLQEEGPAIGKPVVVLREVTERTEAIEAGRAVLVGSNPDSIFDWCSRLLSDEDLYNQMSQPFTPYLAGSAAERIAHFVAADLTA
jgi:UDP-N-acetylglucosamine 2-epimerase (hydrolysing)